MNDRRLTQNIAHSHAGIERAERILKNDLHVAAQAAQFTGAGGQQVMTIEPKAARSGLDQTQRQPAQRALA
jgi:hypothetical protein